jgi:ubiquinone/menaquinone biosynthesis C-methylase UbiE
MNSVCWQEDNLRIQGFYANLVRKHGLAPQALDWGSRQSQELRFQVLTGIANLSGASVLDVGCGLADLLAYLQTQGVDVQYKGIDLNAEGIVLARQRFPQHTFEVGNLLEERLAEASFDYVFASGIFYLRQVQPVPFLDAMVRAMFGLCRRGVAFNTLSTRAACREAGEFYADPHKVLDLCWQLTPRVVLRHDYLPHDFTVYLYKDGPA